jgi:Domain of unknown function (DUF4307)
MSSATARPDGRYGGTAPRRRPGAVAAVVVLATAFVGWVVWAALGAAAPAATGQVVGFRVVSAHELRVSLVVGGDTGRVICTVQALDRTREVVGVTTATARVGGSGRADARVVVRTRARAVTAVVGGCSTGSD